MSEDKEKASEIEVDLAVPSDGTEKAPDAKVEDKPTKAADAVAEEPGEEDGAPAGRADESDEDRSARAARRRRQRERKREQEEQMLDTIARQGAALEHLYGVVQNLGQHAQGGQLEAAKTTHAQAKADMAKAYESGDPLKVAEATEALTIARLNLDAITHRPTRQPQGDRQPQRERGEPEPRANPYQQAWLAKNDWYNDPERMEDTQIAYAITNALRHEGFDANDPELYQELDRRLKKRGVGTATAPGDREKAKVIVASGQRQSLTPPKKFTINQRVQEHAQKFGIDLSDPATAQRIAKRLAAAQAPR